MSRFRPHCNRHSDGFAVVAVLWIIGALATLAAIYAAYIINTTQAFAANDDRIRAEAAVSAALALTASQLDTPKDKPAPGRGHFAFRLDRARVVVNFMSEAARIDLNAAPKPLLAGLFTTLGATTAQADDYAEAIAAWRTPPQSDGADKEVSLYRAAGLSYDPRQAPFASTAELWLVRGLPLQLVARALPYVTVFSGQAGIDLQDATPMVIAALPGMTPDRLAAVLRQRQADPGDDKALVALLGPLQGAVAAKTGKTTRVNVHVYFNDGRDVQAEAVIKVGAGADGPYRVLSWHDDLDRPLESEHEDVALR
jgi:general secretion pathway protein K